MLQQYFQLQMTRGRGSLLRYCLFGLCALALFFIYLLRHLHPPKGHDPSHDSIRLIDREMFKEDQRGKLSHMQAKFLDFKPNFLHSPSTRIPLVIHQVWDTRDIPQHFHAWVARWLVVNPGWEYWLWTMDDAKQLITSHYPDYLTLFESYPEVIHRADAMRYFILHHFGGVYMDIDMEPLKALNNWTYNYDIILSQECYEHSYIVRGESEPNVVNGVMFSRPHHPFFLFAIQSLPKAANQFFGDFLQATGPVFLTRVLKEYLNATHDLSVTIVPPKFFLPRFDPTEGDTISSKCFPTRMHVLPVEGQTLCNRLLFARYSNEVTEEAFTNHHWVHANMYDEEWKRRAAQPISQILPQSKNPPL